LKHRFPYIFSNISQSAQPYIPVQPLHCHLKYSVSCNSALQRLRFFR